MLRAWTILLSPGMKITRFTLLTNEYHKNPNPERVLQVHKMQNCQNVYFRHFSTEDEDNGFRGKCPVCIKIVAYNTASFAF